jgi:hypothetical protein
MTPIVEAVVALEADDPEFTLEHVLSKLALGGIGLAPTVGGGVKVASLHRTRACSGLACTSSDSSKGRFPITALRPRRP